LYYRNRGARFTSSSGERVAHGQIYRPTADDLLRRAYKLVPVTAHEADIESEPVEGWSLATPPADYLLRYPDGPHADEARRLVGED
jgi:hypothetical protein